MQISKFYSRTALIVMAVLFLLIWVSSCINPYKHLPNRPPLTPKDSAALLARCIQISPLDTTTTQFLPQIPTPPDSSAHFKAIADSLAQVREKVRDSILIKYKDTCRSAVRIYNEAYNLGYKIGKSDGRSDAETIYNRSYRTTDSLYRLQTAKLKHDYNLRLIAAENKAGIAEKAKEKYRVKAENRGRLNLWLAIAAAVFLILCILLWKFRRQAKAANKTVNSVLDVVDSLKK